MKPDRKDLAPGLSISRILTGLWQVADQEKDGVTLDPVAGAAGADSLCKGRLRHLRHGGSLW